jgi:hypothetical protein
MIMQRRKVIFRILLSAFLYLYTSIDIKNYVLVMFNPFFLYLCPRMLKTNLDIMK